MKPWLQFVCVLALLLGAALLAMPTAAAQRGENAFRQDRQDRPPRREERRDQRQPRQQENQQKQQGNRLGNAGNTRPPAATPPRGRPDAQPPRGRPNTQPPPRNVAPPSPPSGGRAAPPPRDFAPQGNANRRANPPFGYGAQASLEHLRNMSPQDRERVLQNNQRFNSLSPEGQSKIRQNFQRWDRLTPLQKDDLLRSERNWRSMTPQQRDHVRTDILPRWQQMPPDRRQAIMQRLRVLQSMPDSARNQRLNDSNFTRGMSFEDQSLLRDLTRLRVGGAPEPPSD